MRSHAGLLNKHAILLAMLAMLLAAFDGAGAQLANPRFRLAQSLLKNGEYREALTIYQELYRDKPQDVPVIKGMQECYLALQEFEPLIRLLTRAAAQFPSDINWQINLAEAWYLNNDQAQANEVWYRILDHQPGNIGVYRKVAASMISQRLLDQAIDVYLSAQQHIAGQENLHIDIANLYKLQLAYGRSTRHYLEFFIHNPNQKGFVQNQILTLTDEAEKVPEILAAIEDFSRRFPERRDIIEIGAGVHIKLGEYDRALQSYRQLEDGQSAGAYLVQFAVSARNNGAFREALQAYRLVLEMYPDFPNRSQIQYDMANCYKNMAAPGATEHLDRAVSLYDSLAAAGVSAQIRLASLENLGDIYYRHYFDLDRAQRYYGEYLKGSSAVSSRDRVLLKLGDVYRAKNDLGNARQTYQQIRSPEYQNTAGFKLTELIYFSGRFQQAEAGFDQLLLRIGHSHALTNDILGYLADIRAYRSDSLALAAFSRAQLLQLREKRSESAEIFGRLVYDKSPVRYRALISGVTNHIALANYAEALRLLAYYQENWPDDLNLDAVYYWRGVTLEHMDDPRTALENFQTILVRYPNSLYIEEARSRARVLDTMLKKEQS